MRGGSDARATTLYQEATRALHSGEAAGAAAGYRRCLEIRVDPAFRAMLTEFRRPGGERR